MFDNIAGKYDFLNHFLSLGIDKVWRKKAIKKLKTSNPQRILDIACGTGDFSIEALKLNPTEIIGIDISKEMLKVGIEKIKKKNLENIITLKLGDSENLEFENNYFDAAIVAFGVRNFETLQKGLKEIQRVLKPGGVFIVLEFSKPKYFPFKQFYNFYFLRILPVIGKLFSKDNSAYTYLPESVQAFPDGENFIKELETAGFNNCELFPQTLGVATIYMGEK
ncbi:MAG: bifunctional demethylmenaquinone methyltransferase/2-methoxy-6-polyprenyl-1,4-benzoquinol methylase UbiE [Saprospiraceae bacterium]|nr:bifunctional demethylmenaquinone methyltransferase/2-methoxy-6-polyprenyl-1,4-benzoquinol methylase UbiE [Saprospiraceae bacterium]